MNQGQTAKGSGFSPGMISRRLGPGNINYARNSVSAPLQASRTTLGMMRSPDS